MSFVALGGDGSTRPTFFELVAAERLMPSLKAATIYSLSVSSSHSVEMHTFVKANCLWLFAVSVRQSCPVRTSSPPHRRLIRQFMLLSSIQTNACATCATPPNWSMRHRLRLR